MKIKLFTKFAKVVFSAASVFLLFPVASIAQVTVFDDPFDGTSLDTETWTPSGWHSPHHDVSGGYLDMWIDGHSHHAAVFSKEEGLNFFEYDLTIRIVLDPTESLQPAPSFSSDENYILGSMAIVEQADHTSWRNADYPGANFSLVWRPKDGASALYLWDQEITEVPSELEVSLDATEISVALTGATFVGSGLGTSTWAHGLSANEFSIYRLMLATCPIESNYPSHLKIDRVTVLSDREITGGETGGEADLLPVITSTLDPSWEGMDATCMAEYAKILASMPDLEDEVPDARDFSNVVFIDPSATNNGSGTSASDPLNSWAEVSFNSGTAYLQKCGTSETLSARLQVGSNVLIGAYGEGERPLIRVTETVGGDSAAIEVGSYTTVRDVHVQAPHVAACIKVTTAQVTVYNCELEESIWGVRRSGDGLRLLKNIIHGTKDDGVYIQNSTGVTIGWNFIFHSNIKWTGPATTQDEAPGDNVQFIGVADWYVHHNVLDRSSTGNKFSFISNGAGSGGECLCEHNYMIAPHPDGKGGSALYFGDHETGFVTVRYNTFDRGINGLFHHLSNIEIYGNIFWRVGGGVTSNGNNPKIYNNVFYDIPGKLIIGGGIIHNNVFDLGTNGLPYSVQGSTVVNNHCYGPQYDIPDNFVGDPGFVDPENGDFHLRADSSLIDAGVDVGLAEDREGTAVPYWKSPDIGAFEYVPEYWIQVYQEYPNYWKSTPLGYLSDYYDPWVYIMLGDGQGQLVPRWIYLHDPYVYQWGFYAYDLTEDCWLWIPKTSPAQVYSLGETQGWMPWGQ